MLSLLRIWFQFLVRELKSHKSHSTIKGKKKRDSVLELVTRTGLSRDTLSLHHYFHLERLKGWRLQSSEISATCLIVDVGTGLGLTGGRTPTCGLYMLLLDLFTG